ncbi:CHRD domain-containing protein [Streptomyces sp. NPDC054842]
MTVRRTMHLTALAALPAALALGFAGSAVADSGNSYQVNLEQLNNTGANGTAVLSLDGDQLTVRIETDGLVPNAPHAQHIHGSTDGHDFHCPDGSADKNGDGVVTTTEGVPAYGDINISLTTKGDTSKDSGLAVDRMPTADSKGHVSYERTISVSQAVADHIKDLHVVQHGIDPNGNGTYDFSKGKSELDPKLPQEATAPAACGMLQGAAVGSMPAGGVETGGGTTDGVQSAGLLATGGILLAGSAGALVVALRHTAPRGR